MPNSNPSFCAREKALILLQNQGFFVVPKRFDDYYDDYSLFGFSKPIIGILHAVCAFFLHTIGDMAVNVKRKRCSSVANVLLYGFDVVTILQREHGVGMLKIMKTNIWQAESRNSFLEMLVDCCGAKMFSDFMTCRLIHPGFLFLTVVILSGAIWVWQAWGRWWSWDSKEFWTLILRILYAICLHQRICFKRQGKRMALLALIAVFCVLFTFAGVKSFCLDCTPPLRDPAAGVRACSKTTW